MPDYPIPYGMHQQGYDPNFAPQMIKQSADFDKWRLDTESIADQLENQLRGFVWKPDKDGNGGDWVKGSFPAPVNEIGAAELANIIRDLNNRVTFLSELNDDEIDKICLDINKSMVGLFFMNWDLWQVRKESARWIVAKMMALVFIGLKRAKGRGEAELMAQVTSISRNIFEGGQQKQGGVFNLFRRNKNQQGQMGY